VAEGGAILGHLGVRTYGQASVTNAGDIQGSYTGIEVHAWGGARALVTNSGTISAQQIAVYAPLGDLGVFTMVNRGEVSSGGFAVALGGAGTASARLVNHGTFQGEWAYLGSSGSDKLVNRGQLIGHVDLISGDDIFDNRGGTVEGTVYGGYGDDLFLPGAGAEDFEAGDGIDTLDFRGSAGLRVSLADQSGSGLAEGDSYLGFERVLGSRSGADTILGGAEANTFLGFGGDDTLSGGAGNDRLVAGAGADRLCGGQGDDVFEFLAPGQGGDLVDDFRNVAGNDDRIEISAEGFGLVAGALLESQFVTRDMDNKAQDGDDRFVFCLSDRTLWFDADGRGGEAAVLIADLQKGAALAFTDIVLV
jgi:hypothetical protein